MDEEVSECDVYKHRLLFTRLSLTLSLAAVHESPRVTSRLSKLKCGGETTTL